MTLEELKKQATYLINSGFSIIPVKGDTVENINYKKKPSLDTWDEYKVKAMPLRYVPTMFLEGNFIGVVCGGVSHNLECLDFDNKLGNIDEVWKEYISYNDVKSIVEKYNLYIEKTLTGGRHLVWKNAEKSFAGTNLAFQFDDKGKPLCIIETRGEGQYFICAPSNGYIQTYPKPDSGKGLADIIPITEDERQVLVEIAMSFTMIVEDKNIIQPPRKHGQSFQQNTGELKPGAAYEQDPNVYEDVVKMLTGEGWRPAKHNNQHWIRPGKTEAGGIGGTLGTIKGYPNHFYVFTSNAFPLEQGKFYSPFALKAALYFGGDFSDCASALAKEGYGDSNKNTQSEENGNYSNAYRLAYEIIKKSTINDFSENDVDLLVRDSGLSREESEKILSKLFEQNKELIGIDNLFFPVEKAERFLSANYDIKRNIIKNELIIIKKLKGGGREQINEDSLYTDLLKSKYKISKTDLESVLNSNFVRDFNELEDFFKALLPYSESDPDYISNFANCFQCKDETMQPFFITMLKKNLVRCIRQLFEGIENRNILTLVGSQDRGKTRWIRHLSFNNHYFQETNPIRMKLTDMQMAMSENFLWNIEELDSYTKSQVTALKQIISKASERFRAVYGKQLKTRFRIANFFASTNEKTFLTDDTGNTRFLIFEGDIVSFDYSGNNGKVTPTAPTDRIWAQAYYLYKNGFECELTRDEKEIRDFQNIKYEVQDGIDSLILMHFEPVELIDDSGDINSYYFWPTAKINIFLQIEGSRMVGIGNNTKIHNTFEKINKRYARNGSQNMFHSVNIGGFSGRLMKAVSEKAIAYHATNQDASSNLKNKKADSGFGNDEADEMPF